MVQKFDSYEPTQLTSMYNLKEVERQRLDDSLKTVLIERKLISPQELQEALEYQKSTNLSLWRTIINLGMLTPKDMADLLKFEAVPIQPVSSASFGVFLVEKGFITKQLLREATKLEKEQGKTLGDILLEMKCITEENLSKAMALQYGLPFVNLAEKETDKALLDEWPQQILTEHLILPLERKKDRLVVAFGDPANIHSFLESHLRFFLGRSIEPCIAPPRQIAQKLEQYSGKQSKLSIHITPEQFISHRAKILKALVEKSGMAKVTDYLVHEAFALNASDIHIEDMEESTRVRFRIDGYLHEIITVDKKVGHSIMTRIKVSSNMDITEKRIPMDGHGSLSFEDVKLEFRVSSVPSCFGDKMVLRLFYKKKVVNSFTQMGLLPEQREVLSYFAHSPYGMFLTTGPVGSGKTTTLYALLNHIDILRQNVMTIEDPIEYYLPGVNQVQVSANMGFTDGLRGFLRQDPDVIMVGEIRDETTANIAIRAALTGILVLSTLHTAEAAGAIITLKNFGIKDFLIASALLGVVNQRLVRKACPACREQYQPDSVLLSRLGVPPDSMSFTKGKGCNQCLSTGYRGRTGIYEVMFVDDEIKRLTMSSSTIDNIKEAAMKAGMKTLKQNGLALVQSGVTTIEEVAQAIL